MWVLFDSECEIGGLTGDKMAVLSYLKQWHWLGHGELEHWSNGRDDWENSCDKYCQPLHRHS